MNAAEIDVAVNLADVVRRARDLVLDQLSALEGGDLSGARSDVHTHQITTDGLALAGSTATALQLFFVQLDRLARSDGLDRHRPLTSVTARLLLLVAVLPLTTLTTAASSTTPSTAATTARLTASTRRVRAIVRIVGSAILALLPVGTVSSPLRCGTRIADLGRRSAVADLGFRRVSGSFRPRCGIAAPGARLFVLGLVVGHGFRLSS